MVAVLQRFQRSAASLFHRREEEPLEAIPVDAAPYEGAPYEPGMYEPSAAEPWMEPIADQDDCDEQDEDWDGDEQEVDFTISPVGRLLQIMPQTFRYQGRAAHGAIGSMLVHIAVLVMVASAPVIVPTESSWTDLRAWVLQPDEEDVELLEPELTLAPPSDEQKESVFASLASSVAFQQDDHTELLREPDPRIEIDPQELDLQQVEDITGFLSDEIITRHGTIGEAVVNVDGAVDRITHEIASRLEKEPVLVIYLMDQSISMVDEHQKVAQRLERIYQELDQLNSLGHRSMLSAVWAFGQGQIELVPPTIESRDVLEAIRNVPVDDSGMENVFTTVSSAIKKYKPLITREQRKTMVVIWTDESGDDYAQIEEAVYWCRKLSIPVYAVGPSAMFGREMGSHAYKNPEDGETYMIPVNRGPDAVHQERLRLPYWFEGDQYDVLHAGIGPFALTRLSVESGGTYFINEQEEDQSKFRLDVMRQYLPDYNSVPEYIQKVNASPLRRAIMQAVEISHQETVKGTPRLLFEPTGATYINDLADAQKSVAFNQRTLEMTLAPFARGMEAEYQKETSKRWRAWYDLTYGRLLAMTVRSNEYNWICAEMKRKGADFVDQKSNRWRFKPSPEIKFSSTSAKQAEEAIRLLTRCVEQNPGTPWAVMAQRELKDALGFKIEEHYVAPPPPPKPRPVTPATVPPPPPVVNPPAQRPPEQPRMLARPQQPKLPKL